MKFLIVLVILTGCQWIAKEEKKDSVKGNRVIERQPTEEPNGNAGSLDGPRSGTEGEKRVEKVEPVKGTDSQPSEDTLESGKSGVISPQSKEKPNKASVSVDEPSDIAPEHTHKYEPKDCDDTDLTNVEKNLCEYVESKRSKK